MSREKRKILYLISLVILVLALAGCGTGDAEKKVDAQREKTANYVMTTIADPASGSVGGDWAVLGVVKSGIEVEEDYVDRYYDSVKAAVKSTDGVLSSDSYTEYSRTVIVLSSIGKDPLDIDGYNLAEPLSNYEKVLQQEFNGPAYALIALKTSEYQINNESQYVNALVDIASNKPFYEGSETEADYLSMLLQALSFYKGDAKVDEVIKKSVDRLKEIQGADGSYGNCESTAQAIIGLVAAGENPYKIKKSGTSIPEGLLKYVKDDGFSHVLDGEIDEMSTEQALLAMDALHQMKEGKNLYE